MFGFLYDYKFIRGGGDVYNIVCVDWDVSARNSTACSMDFYASRFTIVNLVGLFVDMMKDVFFVCELFVVKCVCLFCVGVFMCLICVCWYGKNMNCFNVR